MTAYATRDDVLARAGRVGGAFSVAGKRPNLTDLDAFTVDASAQVDEAVRARGFDPAGLDANAQAGLKDLVAYGALARALRALGDRTPEVQELLVEADAVWSYAMGDQTDAGSIAEGTYPVIAALEAGAGGTVVLSAGSLWDDDETCLEPEDFVPLRPLAGVWGRWGRRGPAFRRGQKL